MQITPTNYYKAQGFRPNLQPSRAGGSNAGTASPTQADGTTESAGATIDLSGYTNQLMGLRGLQSSYQAALDNNESIHNQNLLAVIN